MAERQYNTQVARVESLPEMLTAMNEELARLHRTFRYKERGPTGAARAIRPTHLANYVMAHFFSQPAEVRDQIVAAGRAVLREKRASPKPVYWDLGDPLVVVESEDPGNEVAAGTGGKQRRPMGR